MLHPFSTRYDQMSWFRLFVFIDGSDVKCCFDNEVIYEALCRFEWHCIINRVVTWFSSTVINVVSLKNLQKCSQILLAYQQIFFGLWQFGKLPSNILLIAYLTTVEDFDVSESISFVCVFE